jgi:hypothetical protein
MCVHEYGCAPTAASEFLGCCESLGMQSGHTMYRTDGMCCQLLNVASMGIYPPTTRCPPSHPHAFPRSQLFENTSFFANSPNSPNSPGVLFLRSIMPI